MLHIFDEAGVTSVFMDPEQGGFIEGPKNLALGLVAFELAWVDGGAATATLAGNLALAPIHERGTAEQFAEYHKKASPPQPGEDRKIVRGAFNLTEPLPFVGVDAGMLSGRVRVAQWDEGQEPILLVEKRGRFITNMDYAGFVTAAVDSGDERIKGSCMIILEETDPGLFDRGAATKKLVHQLSSTRDPVFSLRVPAHRIIGGYTIKDGVIIPRYNHSEVIEAVFRRTRVTVALMTSAKVLSAIEPVIRYQRSRYRGGAIGQPGTPRYDLGIQMKEDAVHRLVDVWASGEASASLGFTAARLFDTLDPIEKQKDKIFEEQGITGRRQLAAFKKIEAEALEFIELDSLTQGERNEARYQELKANTLVQFVVLDAEAGVMCPACKLWNTGYGANMMREAVSLMGGYGITEDCPGFLGQKWMDAQLEATYEGPEAVQRRQMSVTMTNKFFLARFRTWIQELRQIAFERPGTGACTLATAMKTWLWAFEHLQGASDANGTSLYNNQRQGVTFPLADALAWLMASRCQILDLIELETKGPENPVVAAGLEGTVQFFTDLCHVQAARAAGEVGRICAELVYGYNRHPAWDQAACSGCYEADELDDLESIMPGIGAMAGDVLQDGKPVCKKAGPCVKINGLEQFARLRTKMDACLTGARLAKDRAALAVQQVMIPEALDY
jgi:alkylation response protein AidB-like acyl-CoA dehydrogenase